MQPYLVRGPVVDTQGEGSPAHVEAERLPGERLLENALAEIAGKEEAFRPAAGQRGEEPRFGDAEVLRFVDDGEIERPLASRQALGQAAEHVGPRHRLPL